MPLKSFNEVVLLYALRERPDFADTCRRFLEECANRDAAEIGLARELDKGLEVIFRDPCAFGGAEERLIKDLLTQVSMRTNWRRVASYLLDRFAPTAELKTTLWAGVLAPSAN
jgi:hypothetical protein